LLLLRLSDGTLASGHDDGAVRLCDVHRGEAVSELRGHTEAVRDLAQLRDGRLASVSEDDVARLWDVAARACVVVTTPSAPCCCCATAAGELAMGCDDGTMLVLGFAWARRTAAVVVRAAESVGLKPCHSGRIGSPPPRQERFAIVRRRGASQRSAAGASVSAEASGTQRGATRGSEAAPDFASEHTLPQQRRRGTNAPAAAVAGGRARRRGAELNCSTGSPWCRAGEIVQMRRPCHGMRRRTSH